MRKLMWFTVGFGAACALGAYFYAPWLLPGGILFLLIAALLMVLKKLKQGCRVFAAVCFGIAAGMLWFSAYDTVYLSRPREMDDTTAELTIAVTDYSYETKYGCAVDGVVTIGGKPYLVRAYLKDDMDLEIDHTVTGTFRLRLTTAGGAEDALYHQGKGIFFLAYQAEDCDIGRTSQSSLLDYPAIWREELKTAMDASFPEDAAAFCKALLLGDKTGLDYQTMTDFRVSGVSHIIAVSGLHISILFGAVYLLSGRKRVLTALIGIPAVILFAAVAGFTPSVTRACLMQILVMLAMLLDREYDPLTALSFAGLVMLIFNPLVITSVSFQLSFGCMIGIFLFSEKIRLYLMDAKRLGRWSGKFARWLAVSVSVSLSAQIFTVPLAAIYFGSVSLVGVVTNLLILWVITFIFYGVLFVCAVYALRIGIASFLGNVVAWPVRYVLKVTEILGSMPLSAVYTKSIYIVIWLVFVYVLLGIFAFARKKPVAFLCGFGALGLCIALAASWAEPLFDGCRVTVLNVGQGQSILLQSGGKTFLVDCGGDYSEDAADVAADTLLSQGISCLDGMILTHYDEDHAGGAANLLTRVDTKLLLMPYIEDDERIGRDLAEQVGERAYFVDRDLELQYGNLKISVFAPMNYNSGNESCISILFQSENCDILITGDMGSEMEKLLLKNHKLPELELLVVGHHGSKYSTCEELLAATTPEYAFISVGADNFYGHPTPEVLDRLDKYGCIVYRTDQNGTIIFRR